MSSMPTTTRNPAKRRSHASLDQPWRRPGRLTYARERCRAALHPPVSVYPMPAGVTKDEDVAVRMRDGATLRLNLFRPASGGPFPVILSAHPYGTRSPGGRSRLWARRR